jgi:hypothetical protein
MTKKKIFTTNLSVSVKAVDEKTAIELLSKVLEARKWAFKLEGKVVESEVAKSDKLAKFRPAKEVKEAKVAKTPVKAEAKASVKPAVKKEEAKKPVVRSIGMDED